MENVRNNYMDNWYKLTDFIKRKSRCDDVPTDAKQREKLMRKKHKRKFEQQVRIDDGLYYDTKFRLMFKKNESEKEQCSALLKEWGLSQYQETFIEACGYNDMRDWLYLSKQDLMDVSFSERDANVFITKLKEQTRMSYEEVKKLRVPNKEIFINDKEFEQIFEMTKLQFYKQKPLEQKNMKRAKGIF